ncbi:ATPase, partial [Burkholderia sp. SIMBA_019]
MSLHLQQLGQTTFARAELAPVDKPLEGEMVKLEEYVDEQLRVATAYREQREKDMQEKGDFVFSPEIVRPAIEL